MTEFADFWSRHYGDAQVRTRDVANDAFSSVDFYAALCRTIPEARCQPHPTTIGRWLTRAENLPLKLSDGTVRRFAREGHRWKLMVVDEEVAQLAAE